MSDSTQPQRSTPPDKGPSQLGKYTGVGMQMLATIGLCTWAGVWLDGKMGWSPWGTVGLALFGVFVAMYQIIRVASHDK